MTTQIAGKQHHGYKTYNCAVPKKESISIPITMDFTGGNTVSIIDLTLTVDNQVFEFLQAIFIDNSANASSLTVVASVTGQSLVIPPLSQAYMPVVIGDQPVITGTSSGGVKVPLQLLNFPISTLVWSTVSSDGLSAVTITPSPATDASSTITLGGTAQNIFGATIPTNGYAVYNPDPTNDLWISDTTTAAANAVGSIRVAANGGGYESPLSRKPVAAVSIVGASTGQIFTASRW